MRFRVFRACFVVLAWLGRCLAPPGLVLPALLAPPGLVLPALPRSCESFVSQCESFVSQIESV